jgi:hypothetical protein
MYSLELIREKINAIHLSATAMEEWIRLTQLDSFSGVSSVFLLIFGADFENLADYPEIQ